MAGLEAFAAAFFWAIFERRGHLQDFPYVVT